MAGQTSLRPWLAGKLCEEIRAAIDWKHGVSVNKAQADEETRFSDDGSSFRSFVSQGTWSDNVQLLQVISSTRPIRVLLSDGYHHVQARLFPTAVASLEKGLDSELVPNIGPLNLQLKVYTIVSSSWGLDRVLLDVESLGFKGRLSKIVGDPVSIEEDASIIEELDRIESIRSAHFLHKFNVDESEAKADTSTAGTSSHVPLDSSRAPPVLPSQVSERSASYANTPLSIERTLDHRQPLSRNRRSQLTLESDGLEIATGTNLASPLKAGHLRPESATALAQRDGLALRSNERGIIPGVVVPRVQQWQDPESSAMQDRTQSPDVISETPIKTTKVVNSAENTLSQDDTTYNKRNPSLTDKSHADAREMPKKLDTITPSNELQTTSTSDVSNTPDSIDRNVVAAATHTKPLLRSTSPEQEKRVSEMRTEDKFMEASVLRNPKFNSQCGLVDIPDSQQILLNNSAWFPPHPGMRFAQPNVPLHLLLAWNEEAASDAYGGDDSKDNDMDDEYEPTLGHVSAETSSSDETSDDEVPASQWPGSPSQRSVGLPPDSSPVHITDARYSVSDDLEIAAPRPLTSRNPREQRATPNEHIPHGTRSSISTTPLQERQSHSVDLEKRFSSSAKATNSANKSDETSAKFSTIKASHTTGVNPTNLGQYEHHPDRLSLHGVPSRSTISVLTPSQTLTSHSRVTASPQRRSHGEHVSREAQAVHSVSLKPSQVARQRDLTNADRSSGPETHQDKRRKFFAGFQRRQVWLEENYVPDPIGKVSLSMIATFYCRANKDCNPVDGDVLLSVAESAFGHSAVDPETRYRPVSNLAKSLLNELEENVSSALQPMPEQNSHRGSVHNVEIDKTRCPGTVTNYHIGYERDSQDPVTAKAQGLLETPVIRSSSAEKHKKATSIALAAEAQRQSHAINGGAERPSDAVLPKAPRLSSVEKPLPRINTPVPAPAWSRPPSSNRSLDTGELRRKTPVSVPRSVRPSASPLPTQSTAPPLQSSATVQINSINPHQPAPFTTPKQEFSIRWRNIRPSGAFATHPAAGDKHNGPGLSTIFSTSSPAVARPTGVSILSWTI